MQQVDFLIAGGRLAGLTLAYSLTEISSASILVLDDENPNAASSVAAGILNPITGRRHVKTWMAAELFPVAFEFYRKLESLSNEKFFFPCPIAEIYDSIKTKNDWQARSAEPGYEKFIGKEFGNDQFGNAVNAPYGGIFLQHSAMVKTDKCIQALKKILAARKVKFENVDFRFDEFRFEKEEVVFRNVKAEMTVFCEGWKMIYNPLFNHHQMLPVKGDLLVFESRDLKLDCILMSDGFIGPLEDNKFLAGSTYNRNFTDEQPDIISRKKIEKFISKLLNVSYRVIDHRSGIRPAMQSRRPVAEIHPDVKRAAVFNGLGTKGFLLAPYFSNKMAAALVGASAHNK
ncbi:MAG: FAD-binding oxidoreductase [Bacteroidia bacterium]|nr:FAD-binding oxidoreductase [Bacteroidia bacterium]